MLTVVNSFIPPVVNLGLGLVGGDPKTGVFGLIPFAGSVYAIVNAAENGMYATAVVGGSAAGRGGVVAPHARRTDRRTQREKRPPWAAIRRQPRGARAQ